MNTKEYALIVAGGSGSRMKTDIPKQFLYLKEKPVLMHTLEKFYRYSNSITLILVLPEQQITYWEGLCKKHSFNIPHQIVYGGDTRFQSVKNGLAVIDEANSLVAIHDGVRPLISLEIIAQSFKVAQDMGTGIASVPLKDSIRLIEKDQNKAMNRANFRIVQTPQTFRTELIKKAFEAKEQTFFTDDASVAEFSGFKIVLIDGNYENIKITTPEDLLVAEALMNSRSN